MLVAVPVSRATSVRTQIWTSAYSAASASEALTPPSLPSPTQRTQFRNLLINVSSRIQLSRAAWTGGYHGTRAGTTRAENLLTHLFAIWIEERLDIDAGGTAMAEYFDLKKTFCLVFREFGGDVTLRE